MGLLRALLAFSVLAGHAGLGLKLLPGDAAVQTFYVISGFYMALVLNTNRAYADAKTFLTQRALRLFPVYWVVLAATILLILVLGPPARLHHAHQTVDVTPPRVIAYLFSNVFILGQDAFLYTEINPDGSLSFQPSLNSAKNPAEQLLPVPQAWTLSLEMMFYALAPFLLRRSKRLLLLLIALSVTIRLVLVAFGFHGEPWSYRFFPSELALFLTGAMGYRLVTQQGGGKASWLKYILLVSVVMIAVILGRPEPGQPFHVRPSYPAMWILVAAVPWLFQLTKTNRYDRVVGELSYPIYICHMIAIFAAEKGVFGAPRPIVTVMVGVALAVVFYTAVDIPLERFRHRLLKKPSAYSVNPF
jgi:peptidoglycan/LPS O-acetylase OafA/YrhL